MDIKEEHDEFFHELDGRGFIFQNKKWLGGCFEDDQLQVVWEMWQAKAQVPEGFVLVPKEPTEVFKEHLKNHLFDLWAGDHGCDWDGFVSVDAISQNTIWKMMIEAGEQNV